jgi:hypothetical protein
VRALNTSLPCVAPLRTAPSVATTSPSTQLLAADFAYIWSPPAAPVLTSEYRGPYVVHKKSNSVYCESRRHIRGGDNRKTKTSFGRPTYTGRPNSQRPASGLGRYGVQLRPRGLHWQGVVLMPVIRLLYKVKIPVMMRENPPIFMEIYLV